MSLSNARGRLDLMLSPDPLHIVTGPGVGLTLGVLALQGDFREHRVMFERLGARTLEVRHPGDLAGLDGLVIPGGESTTMSKLIDAHHLFAPIRAFHAVGGAVYGTCAGLIMVARETVEGAPLTLGLIDVTVRRNAFGRQVSSFEAGVPVVGLAGGPMHGLFIRAPWIERVGAKVEILATWEGHIVAAREGRVLVVAFHPELTDDARLHELFLHMIRGAPCPADGAEDAATPSVGSIRAVTAACANC
ncbi:MAG TPA: pyridoxal 5'-phosphate synthase glutaminase subunit PdxT [Thermoleophilia bacterium]|nr:pyridoxal 5'-phosphate synthase glutaminase subunit PdxT [Thermoleophilia bacterium]